uniref:Palmitoyltransferase n=1 Tax=Helicotheca tamesis TaxID=374047 RepID=A0A7S2HQJ0_9STRA|mmetsp:Transcript_20125/g.27601  ORF Transcript_20125/g.27601 Transcript_20125/m.27601 type:complete len:433 (+) Transcript_20125:93-1391(+)
MEFGLILQTIPILFFIYAFIISDPDESPLADFFQNRLPNSLMNCGRRIVGPKAIKKMESLSQYFLQVVYLVVVLGSWSVMFAYGYPLIEKSSQVSSYHKYSGYVVFALCMGSWRYACGVSPGYITENSIPKFDNYPYDNLLYTDKLCPTVKIRKLARSKYDRFSKRHVARFDHFCGWLNQAVGEENYRYFLFFLIVHFFMCAYGSVVTALLFYGEIVDRDLLNATFINEVTGAEVKADKWVVFQYLVTAHYYLSRVFLVMVVVALALGVFLGFHLYITSRGMTTNEHAKWKEVRKLHKKYKMNYEKALKEGKVFEQASGEHGEERCDDSDKAGDGSNDSDIKYEGSSNDLNPLAATDKTENEIIDPGPFPQNIYNAGIIENFKEVIYPRSLREDAIKRWVDWHRSEKHLRNNSQGNSKCGEIDVMNGKTKTI